MQKSVLQNIENCGIYCQKKRPKKAKLLEVGFFEGFLVITPTLFFILQNGFLHGHQCHKALLVMYNTAIFENNDFLTFLCDHIKQKCWLRKIKNVVHISKKAYPKTV